MKSADLKFVEAYRAAHAIQAHALRLVLEEAGIRVIIENEALQGAIGDVPCGWSSAPRLMVDESQLAAARALINQTDHSERANLELKPHETAIAMTAAFFGIAGIAGAALTPSEIAEPEPIETTHCLSCNEIMDEAEATCPKCGWSYEPDDSVEPL
ncbi:MAG: DUF2007 domain-containing protein [Planctomycetaceae bacterium]